MTRRRDSLVLAFTGRCPYHTAIPYRMTDSTVALWYKQTIVSLAPKDLESTKGNVHALLDPGTDRVNMNGPRELRDTPSWTHVRSLRPGCVQVSAHIFLVDQTAISFVFFAFRRRLFLSHHFINHSHTSPLPLFSPNVHLLYARTSKNPSMFNQ